MEKQWTMSGMVCEDNRGLIPLGGDISAEETRETLSVNDLIRVIFFFFLPVTPFGLTYLWDIESATETLFIPGPLWGWGPQALLLLSLCCGVHCTLGGKLWCPNKILWQWTNFPQGPVSQQIAPTVTWPLFPWMRETWENFCWFPCSSGNPPGPRRSLV